MKAKIKEVTSKYEAMRLHMETFGKHMEALKTQAEGSYPLKNMLVEITLENIDETCSEMMRELKS